MPKTRGFLFKLFRFVHFLDTLDGSLLWKTFCFSDVITMAGRHNCCISKAFGFGEIMFGLFTTVPGSGVLGSGCLSPVTTFYTISTSALATIEAFQKGQPVLRESRPLHVIIQG